MAGRRIKHRSHVNQAESQRSGIDKKRVGFAQPLERNFRCTAAPGDRCAAAAGAIGRHREDIPRTPCERHIGAPVLFVNGAVGDVSPRSRGWTGVQAAGAALADGALRARQAGTESWKVPELNDQVIWGMSYQVADFMLGTDEKDPKKRTLKFAIKRLAR